ncbi:MAG: hypothetical protein ACLPXB_04945 [Thiobacillaceae bacterium]
MKTVSLSGSSVSLGAPADRSSIERFFLGSVFRVVRLIRKQADVFAAIALGEGGDHEGAADLLARSNDTKR